MNIDNITKLQQTIAKQPHTNYQAPSGFAMQSFKHVRGTPSCIGGFVDYLNPSFFTDSILNVSNFLGISNIKAHELCYPTTDKKYQYITPEDAVQALENIKNGVRRNMIWVHTKQVTNKYTLIFDLKSAIIKHKE